MRQVKKLIPLRELFIPSCSPQEYQVNLLQIKCFARGSGKNTDTLATTIINTYFPARGSEKQGVTGT